MLWREDPEEVRSLYHSIVDCRVSGNWLSSYHRSRENKKKAKLLTRNKVGLTLKEVAKRSGISRPTLVSLLEYYGLIDLSQFGLDQKRRLVTKAAYRAQLGHNVNPANRIGHLEGYGKAAHFPVFYEDKLPDILWMIDYPAIVNRVDDIPNKKLRLAWLLSEHPYLPDIEIAALAGYSTKGVFKARTKSPHTMDLSAA